MNVVLSLFCYLNNRVNRCLRGNGLVPVSVSIDFEHNFGDVIARLWHFYDFSSFYLLLFFSVKSSKT